MVASALTMLAGSQSATGQDTTCAEAQAAAAEMAGARLIVEYNATDEDLGVHGQFEADGWSELCVFDPTGKLVLEIRPQSQLRDLGVGSIFFESQEPPAEQFSFDELKAAFPEGEYSVRAVALDGQILGGSADFTHDIPAAPSIIRPTVAEDEASADSAVVPIDGRAVEWEPVTETVEGEPVTITAYEVIITNLEHDDPHGFSQPVFDVHVPASTNLLTVSPEFLEPDTSYELEVLALELSGNQTISVGFFKTE